MSEAEAQLRERLRENSVVIGPRVVTSAHPSASAAGANAYAAGGNAFDAALAACFMETVALPMKCGLGGDLVALFRRANGPFEAVLSIGPGPSGLAHGERLERVGPRSVGIPGAPAGYTALHRFANLPLDALVAPAVRASETGIAWTRVALSYLIEAKDLLASVSPGHPYAPDGNIPNVGDIRRLPGLGDLLNRFAATGADVFASEAGEALASEVRRRGGFLTTEDMRSATASLRPARRVTLSGAATLIATPAPTGGPRLTDVVHRALSSDDDLVSIIRAERKDTKARGLLAEDGGTSVVTAADEHGNLVIVVHSNSFPRFGSGVVLDSGLVLNNRPGRGFDLTAPASARNAPMAGRVPETTLHAWAIERETSLVAGATPGGVNQLVWNAQSVLEILRGASIADVITSPRWALDDKDQLSVEHGLELPHSVGTFRKVGAVSLRASQQFIEIGTGRNEIIAAADPRSSCRALAIY